MSFCYAYFASWPHCFGHLISIVYLICYAIIGSITNGHESNNDQTVFYHKQGGLYNQVINQPILAGNAVLKLKLDR